jgi:formate dehydrogenase subunit delta
MKPNNLIKMANQIGDFFAAMPDQDQAVKDVATHIKKFWEPSMRAYLLDHIKTSGDEGLKPIVRNAMRLVDDN